jgi:uncharacterized protein YfaP (DUF2135 family)
LAVGVLQIVMAWDVPEADVDLDVADPNGESARVGEATALGLVKDRDCPGEADGCGGQNIEVVTSTTDSVPRGRYRVTLTLAKPSPNGQAVLVRVGGHVGQDSIAGQVPLALEKPRVTIEFEWR